MKKPLNIKKFLLPNIPYVFIALFATKLGQAWRLAPGTDFSGKALHLMEGFAAAFQSALPSFHPIDLCVGVAAALLIRLIVYVKGKNAKKFRKNLEYGSARWGKPEDIAPYVDPKFENNVILTQTERLMMSNRPKDPKTARNKNVLVVGGSGSGKTRFFIKPNLMQLHSSYVVTDPKGSIAVECGKLMLRNGYKVKIFNSINFKKSHHYNPFAYIHSEKDILKLVTTLIANTKGDGKSGDDFWQKAETLLYTALIGYIHYEAPEEEQNFATLIEFINAMEVREDDETFENNVDLAFKELASREPNHFAVRQYKKYKLAAGKTAKSINISCGARLAPFDIQELREITMYDELELDTLGDRKTALFLIMSDTDSTFNFLISMIYSQLFNLLCEKADDVYGGRLPVHVRCLIDPEPGKAHGYHPQPRDLRLSGAASPKSAKGAVQGQRRHHHRQLRQLHLFGRQGARHAEGAESGAGERDHRHLQHRREPWTGGFPQPELSEAGQRPCHDRRAGGAGRRQVHLAASRRASLPLGQV